jgi:hypothetical protein
MKKITLFLASSAELNAEREQFELEIYRKCKAWFDRGIFLHLDIWEDLSARMAVDGSQSEYNLKVQAADLFILLVYSKVGMYTGEEFEKAFGQFKANSKITWLGQKMRWRACDSRQPRRIPAKNGAALAIACIQLNTESLSSEVNNNYQRG